MIRHLAIPFRIYCVDYSALRGQTLAFRGHDTDNTVILGGERQLVLFTCDPASETMSTF